MNNSNWYIYIHKRGDNNEPFYVGKGKGRRDYTKENRNTYWNNIVNKCGYSIEIVETCINEEDANKRESYWINRIGRWDLGKGTLVNFTNGGEGSSGRPMSKRTKEILAIANKNRIPSEIQKSIVGAMFRGKSGLLHNKSKSVKCIETGKSWGSMAEAERELNLGGGSVSWSIKHQKPIYAMHFEINQ